MSESRQDRRRANILSSEEVDLRAILEEHEMTLGFLDWTPAKTSLKRSAQVRRELYTTFVEGEGAKESEFSEAFTDTVTKRHYKGKPPYSDFEYIKRAVWNRMAYPPECRPGGYAAEQPQMTRIAAGSSSEGASSKAFNRSSKKRRLDEVPDSGDTLPSQVPKVSEGGGLVRQGNMSKGEIEEMIMTRLLSTKHIENPHYSGERVREILQELHDRFEDNPDLSYASSHSLYVTVTWMLDKGRPGGSRGRTES